MNRLRGGGGGGILQTLLKKFSSMCLDDCIEEKEKVLLDYDDVQIPSFDFSSCTLFTYPKGYHSFIFSQDDIRTRGDSRPFVPPDQHTNLSPMEEDEEESELPFFLSFYCLFFKPYILHYIY